MLCWRGRLFHWHYACGIENPEESMSAGVLLEYGFVELHTSKTLAKEEESSPFSVIIHDRAHRPELA